MKKAADIAVYFRAKVIHFFNAQTFDLKYILFNLRRFVGGV